MQMNGNAEESLEDVQANLEKIIRGISSFKRILWNMCLFICFKTSEL